MRRFGVAEGMLAGAFAALTFHQSAAAVLHALGWFPVAPFDLSAGPGGMPALVKALLWSAGWGAGFVLLWRLPGLRRLPLVVAATGYAASLPVVFLFVVLAWWKGSPLAYGLPAGLASAVVLAHAAWGFGIALWLAGMRGLLMR
ncbi:MAG: hypothetical protein EON47_18500 [Acetobacteraceae bacterium]|nr:MAG: hypothetical protein EON47_18500 [Acetobacteraceae bacterium]